MKKVLLHGIGILTAAFMIFIIGLFVGRLQLPKETLPTPTPTASIQAEPDNTPKININTASLTELCTLPGIGEITANAIIEYRTTNGAIDSPEQLMEIKGIGLKKLEGIIDFISFE